MLVERHTEQKKKILEYKSVYEKKEDRASIKENNNFHLKKEKKRRAKHVQDVG